MAARAYKIALLVLAVVLFSGLSYGQTGMIAGKVIDEKGQPVKDALVKIERLDVRGNYKVKTKKKGDFLHAGLPLGTYSVTLNIDGKDVDQLRNVRVGMDTTEVNFDLAKVAARRQQAQQAAASGQGLSQEQLRTMSAAERKQYEETLKKRREQLGKNKQLNEAFNAGMEAMDAKNYEVAATSFKQANEIDPEQHAVWAQLGEAQSKLALTKTGDERKGLYEESIVAYQKAIELQPESANLYNNLGLILVRAGKIEEGKTTLTKAAEIDPANGGQYYYNLGAIMINTGNNEGAIDAFKKATELDPNYAPAYYQLGTALVGAAEMNPDGSIKPVEGTIDAFQRYLELQPDGQMAAAAQSMIQSLSGNVQTKFEAEKKKKKRSR